MCNKVHEEGFEKILESGVGYKLFSISPSGRRQTWLFGEPYKSEGTEHFPWVKWKPTNPEEGGGFCFFLHLSDIPEQLVDGDTVIGQIVYREGIGSFIEHNLLKSKKGMRIALCKAFHTRSI